MKHRAPWFCVLWAVSVEAFAIGEELDGTYYFRRLTPPPIVSIRVTHPVRRADTAPPEESCKDFKITSRDVRRFFKYAKAVNRSDYREYYLQTGCYGEGIVTYANGMRAEWEIESGGRGVVMPTNGKNKNVLYYLYCDDECDGLGFSSISGGERPRRSR